MYVMKGDFKKAKELCDELNSLSTLRFDPTNPDLRGEWDVRTLGIKDVVVDDMMWMIYIDVDSVDESWLMMHV